MDKNVRGIAFAKMNKIMQYIVFEGSKEGIMHLRSMLGYKYAIKVMMDNDTCSVVVDNFRHGIHVANEGDCIVKLGDGSIVITDIEGLRSMSDDATAYEKQIEDIEYE